MAITKNYRNFISRWSNGTITTFILGFSIFLVLVGVFVTINKNKQPASQLPKLQVVTTIFPLYDIARNIGGTHVEVVQLLPGGASPHTYELKPSDVARVSKSDVVFAIGHGLDDWAVRVAQSEGKKIVVVDAKIDLLTGHEDSGETETSDSVDPHYWLSIPNAMIMAATITQVLSEAYPTYKLEFETNLNEYSKQLGRADLELRAELLEHSPIKMATFHGAWDYSARDYGIQVVAEFEEFPGKEPTPEYLKEFQESIKNNSVKTIYIEPQFSSKPVEAVATDLGVTLVTLDPEGGGIQGIDSYLSLMRYNVSQIVSSQ